MSYLSSMELMEKEDEHIARLTGYFALYRELYSHVGSRPLTLGCKWTKSRLLEAVKAEATMEEDNYQAQVKLGLVSQRPFPPYCTVCMQFLEDGHKCKCGLRGAYPPENKGSEEMNKLHGEQEVESAVTVVSERELEPTCKDVPVRQTGWVIIALNYVHSTPVTPNGLAMIFSSKEEAVAAIEGHLIKTGDKRPLYPVKLREGYANRDVTKTVEKVIHTTLTAPGVIKV